MPRKKKPENLRHRNIISLKLTDSELEKLDQTSIRLQDILTLAGKSLRK